VLARGGYLTAYFGTNPYASPAKNRMGSYFDIRHGEQEPYFSICSDLLSTFLPYDCSAAELPQFLFVRKILNKIIEGLAAQPNWQFDPRACIRPALDWLATTDRHQPVFLWLHFYPPHTPYAAPAPWLGEFDPSPRARDWAHSQPRLAFQFSSTTPEEAHTLEARYDESIKYVDHFVGDFLDQATRLLGDDTVVIVTADHGENFGHGYGQHAGPALYESVIHIPLIIKLPHQTRGQRTSVLAQQIDIGPTLAELVGLGVPSSWEGRSLLNFATAGQPDTPDSPPPIFSMNFEENHRDAALTTGSVAVIDGDWKLVHYAGKLHYPNMPELHDGLFDLASDPGELTNHIDSQPETAQRLRRLIDSNLTRYGAADP
jgi:arylsulfatase A-like enzyme